MDCKQCGAENEEKAIECAFCGGVLRRAYPYDPMGEWLTKLEDKFQATPVKRSTATSAIWTAIGIGIPAGAVTGLAVADLVSGWLGIGAAAFGVLAVLLGVMELLPQRPALARSELKRNAAFAELEAYRCDAEIQRWRLAVILTESLPRGSFLYQSVLAEDESRE